MSLRVPFDWREFLALAHDLHRQVLAGYYIEAAQRTAVSRAYYAVFGVLRDYAVAHLGFVSGQGAQDHQRLRSHLASMGPLWVGVARRMDRLRKWRNMCDYDAVVDNLPLLVEQALALAGDVLQQVARIAQSDGEPR